MLACFQATSHNMDTLPLSECNGALQEHSGSTYTVRAPLCPVLGLRWAHGPW